MSAFDDPRSRQCEALAVQAEQAQRAGDVARARALYAKAAELEQMVVADVPSNAPRIRSVLGVSAVALWYKARLLHHAIALAQHYVALGYVSEDEMRDLRDRIRVAWDEEGLSTAMSVQRVPHQPTALRYLKLLNELVWTRVTQVTRSAQESSSKELEDALRALDDVDYKTIAEELVMVESVEETGDFLFDVDEEEIPEKGLRAAS